jgi:hypothetical protein
MPRTRYPGSQFTPNTTGTEIITRARQLVNEATASFWDDTMMIQWVNDGIMDITGKTWCTGGTPEDIPLVNDTLEYALSNNYITIITCMYRADGSAIKKALLRGHPEMVGHVPNPSEPVYWYEFHGKVGIFPTMSSVGSADVQVYQVAAPSIIVAANNIPIPAFLEDALVLHVVYKALFRDNESAVAQQTKDAYDKEIAMYSRELLEKAASLINDPKAK